MANPGTSNRKDPEPKLIPLTPVEMKNMIGQHLTLVIYRKNKIEKRWIKSTERVELFNILPIYGSDNKLVNVRLIEEDVNVYKPLILAPDGTHIKNPDEISNTYYKLIK